MNIEYSSKKGEYGCPGCKMKIIPRKGVINQWHYAHKIKGECDGANRNKTQWHLDWQKEFKSDFVEVPFVNDTLKKMHIADVMINDLVIEFQHSNISLDEIGERIWNYTATKNVIFVFDYMDSKIIFNKERYIRTGKERFKNVAYNGGYYSIFFQIDENTLLKVNQSYDGFKSFIGEKFTKEQFLNFCHEKSKKPVKKNRDEITSSYVDKVLKDTSIDNILGLKEHLQTRFYYNKDSKLFKKLSTKIDSIKKKEIYEIYDNYLIEKLDNNFCKYIYQKACGDCDKGWWKYGEKNLWYILGGDVFKGINLDTINENVKEVFMKKAKIEMIKKYINFRASKGIVISPKEDNSKFIEKLLRTIEGNFLSGEYGYVLKENIKKIVIENIHVKNIALAIKRIDEEKSKQEELLEYFVKCEGRFRKEYKKIKDYQELIDWWENVSITLVDVIGINELCITLKGIVKGERIAAVQIYKSDVYEDINRLVINRIMKLAKEERVEAIDLFIRNRISGQALFKFKYFTVTEQKKIGSKLGLNNVRYNSSEVSLPDNIIERIKNPHIF